MVLTSIHVGLSPQGSVRCALLLLEMTSPNPYASNLESMACNQCNLAPISHNTTVIGKLASVVCSDNVLENGMSGIHLSSLLLKSLGLAGCSKGHPFAPSFELNFEVD